VPCSCPHFYPLNPLGVEQLLQYSVFEAHLTDTQLGQLEKRLLATIDPKIDSVRLYILGKSWKNRVKMLGQGELTEQQAFVVI
jgi:CRISPR-associated endonuclease Cas2